MGAQQYLLKNLLLDSSNKFVEIIEHTEDPRNEQAYEQPSKQISKQIE